jgi:hypothetical protein
VNFGKTLFAIVGATVLLGALTSAASARNLSTSEQSIRATFREMRFSGGFGTASCELTIEGSFHERTTAKVAGRLVGYLTRSTLGSCSAGSVTVLTETLPWHVRYLGFVGTLPNITVTRATIIGVAFRIQEPGGITCLVRSTATEPATMFFGLVGGVVTGGDAGGTIRMGAECFGASGTLTGRTSSLTALNAGAAVTVTLI